MNMQYLDEKEYLIERLQSLIGCVLLLFVLSSFVDDVYSMMILTTAFLVGSLVLMSSFVYMFALKHPHTLLMVRKSVLIIADMVILTKVILTFGQNGVFFLPFYVLIVMWNGLKLGLFYFYISILGAGISWIILLFSSEYWQIHNDVLASFAITTLIIPLFYMRFITKVHEENYKLSHTLTQVTKDAFHDALTGLKNRKFYNEIFSTRFKEKKPFALMFIDLNKFKSINDTYGHDAGDEVLIEVAKRLKSVMSEEEELFRLGGDEFVIISTRKKAFVPKFVEKLESVVIGPHQIGKISVNIELSLGIAFYPDDTKDAMKLTRYADEAMYKAKKDINVYHKYYNEM